MAMPSPTSRWLRARSGRPYQRSWTEPVHGEHPLEPRGSSVQGTAVRQVKKTLTKEPTMSCSGLIVVVIVAAVLGFIPLTATAQSDTEWKAVEQALGKSGQLQPGDVF